MDLGERRGRGPPTEWREQFEVTHGRNVSRQEDGETAWSRNDRRSGSSPAVGFRT
jgi:hypothetical protein